ncbi:MAG: aminopeptidase [Phycisphaerales bacterium]|jgi:aminopeptidase|nr:aminopeptidase [Phycisphaerales bacterium]
MTTLADLLTGHSTAVEPGEHLLIEAFDVPEAMVVELVRSCRRRGAHPHVAIRSNRVMRALVEQGDDAQFDVLAAGDLERMKRMDAYIGLRGGHNINELSGVDDDRMKAWGARYMQPVHMKQRVNHTRWCVLRWPTPSMAQLAGTSTEAFEDFYFNVCTLDYAAMAVAAEKLRDRMNAADRVHIKGPGDTDLRFSIRDIPAVACTGSHNIPDGECFTAPVRDSVDGVIHFNTPTVYQGTTFRNVRLEFEQGKIVGHDAEVGADRLASVFSADEGAKHVGEFAIGFNPHVLEPMMDILFDEKIAGSLHFTPGQAYEDADNGNRSDIHWDLVLIQRPSYGGGEILFDDEVIRRDGEFVPESLQPLNADRLIGG